MTSGASRCVLFQKTAAVLSSLLYLSLMGEVIIISTCLSAKTQGHKGCLFFKRSCGPAYICSDNSSHFQQKTEHISCSWLQNGEPNQQRGHLIYRGGAHKSSTVDAHMIDGISMCRVTVHLQLQGTQIKQCCEHRYCPETQMRTDKQ